jgi:hypothetical protein
MVAPLWNAPIAVRDGCTVHAWVAASRGCAVGRSSLARQSNARERDLGLGRNAKSRSLTCRQPAREMLHILLIAGVIAGGVSDQHGNLDNAIEPAACRVEDLRDRLKRIPNLFGGGIAPVEPAAGIVRSRRSRHKYETSGFGGPAEGRREPASGKPMNSIMGSIPLSFSGHGAPRAPFRPLRYVA